MFQFKCASRKNLTSHSPRNKLIYGLYNCQIFRSSCAWLTWRVLIGASPDSDVFFDVVSGLAGKPATMLRICVLTFLWTSTLEKKLGKLHSLYPAPREIKSSLILGSFTYVPRPSRAPGAYIQLFLTSFPRASSARQDEFSSSNGFLVKLSVNQASSKLAKLRVVPRITGSS